MFVANIEQIAYTTTSNHIKQSLPALWTNADEADVQIWLHCIHSFGRRKLIFSPDTDVYHIGLTAVQHIPEAEVIVQLSRSYNVDAKFLSLHKPFTTTLT